MEMQMGRIKTRRRPLHENTVQAGLLASYQTIGVPRARRMTSRLTSRLPACQGRVNALAVEGRLCEWTILSRLSHLSSYTRRSSRRPERGRKAPSVSVGTSETQRERRSSWPILRRESRRQSIRRTRNAPSSK